MRVHYVGTLMRSLLYNVVHYAIHRKALGIRECVRLQLDSDAEGSLDVE